MSTFILHIEKRYRNQLGNIRALSNCWIAEDEDKLWLKSEIEGARPLALQQLPSMGWFRANEKGYLFPLQALTPIAEMPTLEWLPVASFVDIELPVAALPAKVSDTILPRLIRSTEQQETNFLLLPWAMWRDYVLAASNIRLNPLSFIVSGQAEVLVFGSPLPPLPGQLFWQSNQVLLPAGWVFEHTILSEILSAHSINEKDELLLYRPEALSRIPPKASFVQASRSSIRKTAEHLETTN